MKNISMFIVFSIFIFTTTSFGANSEPSQDKEKPVLQQGEFEKILKQMTSVDQIFNYLGKPERYSFDKSKGYFQIKYSWVTINDVTVKIDVKDEKTGEHFYAREVNIILFDELKTREEIRKLSDESGRKGQVKRPALSIKAKRGGEEFKILKIEIIPTGLWPTEFTQEERRKREEKTQVITNAFDVIKILDSNKDNAAAIDEYISGIKESLVKGSGVVQNVNKLQERYFIYVTIDGTKTSKDRGHNCILNAGQSSSSVSVLKKGDKIEFSGRMSSYAADSRGSVFNLREISFNKK